jgi:hypothetical protein
LAKEAKEAADREAEPPKKVSRAAKVTPSA